MHGTMAGTPQQTTSTVRRCYSTPDPECPPLYIREHCDERIRGVHRQKRLSRQLDAARYSTSTNTVKMSGRPSCVQGGAKLPNGSYLTLRTSLPRKCRPSLTRSASAASRSGNTRTRSRSRQRYVATAHSVWGILNAPATGEAMAELILGGTAGTVDLSPFDPARLPLLDAKSLRIGP
jgi:hypothetical protein